MALIDTHGWLVSPSEPDIGHVLAQTMAALKGSQELIAVSARGTAAAIENRARNREVMEQSRAAINRRRVVF